MAKCRGCGEFIGFVRLRSGKLMPVESEEPEEYAVWTDADEAAAPARLAGYEVRPLTLVVDGEVLRVYQAVSFDHPASPGRIRVYPGPCKVLGVESHWASCPKAEDFRASR